MDFNTYAYDRDLAENGRKIDLGDDAYLIICRWLNKRMQKRFNDLMSPYSNESITFGKFAANSEVPDEKQADIMRQVVAETVLTNWGGMTDEGVPVEYSVENAIKIFKKHEGFMLDVIERSQDDATFKSQAMDAELGNSATDSEANSESAEKTDKP
jgi:hypothetical protein